MIMDIGHNVVFCEQDADVQIVPEAVDVVSFANTVIVEDERIC